MNARIWLVLSLLAFGISLQNCFGDVPAPAPAGSNTLQVALPNSALTNGASINIGTFVGQGSAPEHDADWYSPLSEFLKALLWVGLIAWVVGRFKKEIAELLSKLKSLRIFGQEAGFSEDVALANQQKIASASTSERATITTPPEPPLAITGSAVELQLVKPAPETSSPDADVEFRKAKSAFQLTPTQKEVLQKIEADVKSSKFTPERQIELGAMAMAQLFVISDFWRIYSFIYGSQIMFLQSVNTSPVKEVDGLYHWFSVKEKFPVLAQNSTSELYFGFLIINGLTVQVEKTYQITPKGREFLVWCTANGLSLNKNF